MITTPTVDTLAGANDEDIASGLESFPRRRRSGLRPCLCYAACDRRRSELADLHCVERKI